MQRDEFIIKYVRESSFMYNKLHKDYNNIHKKKKFWSHLAEIMRNEGFIETAQSVKKRWISLRDMFSREVRKKRKEQSGSEFFMGKEWNLYQSLLFLSFHLGNGRATSSLPGEATATSSTASDEQLWFSSEHVDPLSLKIENIDQDSCASMLSHTESSTGLDVELTSPTDNVSEIAVQQTLQHRTYEDYFDLEPSDSQVSTPMDSLSSSKRRKFDLLGQDVKPVNEVIKSAVATVTEMPKMKEDESKKDNYMGAIEEGLKYVPSKDRTQCLIEILQVIKKYEVRD